MRNLVGCNERYLGTVVRDLQDRGFVDGFCFDGASGVVIDSLSIAAMRDPAITMEGAAYVSENSHMRKCRDFVEHTSEVALSAVMQAAPSCV